MFFQFICFLIYGVVHIIRNSFFGFFSPLNNQGTTPHPDRNITRNHGLTPSNFNNFQLQLLIIDIDVGTRTTQYISYYFKLELEINKQILELITHMHHAVVKVHLITAAFNFDT